MGATADLKVTEIEGTRRQLEVDLRSTVLTAFILRKMRSKSSNGRPTAEVVVRIVREDE